MAVYYITLKRLKDELSIDNTEADKELQTKILAAQGMLERIYRRKFYGDTESPETRVLDYDIHVDGRDLLLPWDVCQVDSIVNGDGETIPPTDYVTTPRLRGIDGGASVLPNVDRAWPWWKISLKANSGLRWEPSDDREEAISVTGVFAFSLTPSENVKSAVARLAWFLYQRSAIAHGGDFGATKEGSFTVPSDLPDDVQILMKGLRRH